MRKVIAQIWGGTGNQLFCYAAARRLSWVTGSELVLDQVSGFERDHTYKRTYQLHRFAIAGRPATPPERLEPFSRLRKIFLRQLNSRRPFEQRNYIFQEGIDFDARLLSVKVSGSVYIEGYWQSEGYFKDIEPLLRRDLAMQRPLHPVVTALSNEIRSIDSVAIHLRFFAPGYQRDQANLPYGYYERAIQYILDRLPSAHFFVFSDYPDLGADVLRKWSDRMTIVRHGDADYDGAHADLWLMSRCKHFIIANSTFSWWGAWLGQSSDTITIAPGHTQQGLGLWGFKGLIPPGWITIDA